MNKISILVFSLVTGLVAAAQKGTDVKVDVPRVSAGGFVGSTLFWIIVIIIILALLSGGGYYSSYRRRRYYGGRRRVIREEIVDDDDPVDDVI